jgi:hypothetical protein
MKKITQWPGVIPYDPADTEHFKTVKREINGQEVDVIFRKGNPGITPEKVAELRAQGKRVPISPSAPI